MELFELLDPTEKRGVQIIQLLLKYQGQAKITTLAEELHVNRLTIKEDLEFLQAKIAQFNDSLTLESNGENVTFATNGKISSLELYYAYLEEAVNYQILLHIYRHGRFSHKALAYKLMISTATLSRRIKQINQILAEFEVTIKNGRMQGTELQIRYFYYLLFWFGRPYHINLQELNDPGTNEFIDLLEKKIRSSFSFEDRSKLQIWLSICKCRMSLFFSDEMQYFKLVDEAAFNDVLFIEVHHLLAHYYSRYAFDWNTNEVQIMFLFLLSHVTLDYQSPCVQELLVDSETLDYPVSRLNRYMLKEIKQIFVEERLSQEYLAAAPWTLYQIHSRFYYFDGFVYFLGYEGLEHLLENLPISILEDYCHSLVKKVEDFLKIPYDKYEAAYRQLFEQYINFIYLGYVDLQFGLKIGCDFPYSKSFSSMFRDNIIFNLDPRIKVQLEHYSEDEEFDLIITNIQKTYPNYRAEQVYILFSLEYSFDFPRLESFIRDYYQEKLMHEVIK